MLRKWSAGCSLVFFFLGKLSIVNREGVSFWSQEVKLRRGSLEEKRSFNGSTLRLERESEGGMF